MTDKHKVRMKIGAFEFEAEGDKESVDEQLRQFLAAIAAAPKVDPATNPHSTALPLGAAPPALAPGGVVPGAMARVFKLENDLLSLRVLPKGKSYAADALLVLLYGYREVKKETEVLSGHLMRSAKQSGLSGIDRVDRVLSAHGDYYIKGGARKGARYALNNRGEEKAREIMARMFD